MTLTKLVLMPFDTLIQCQENRQQANRLVGTVRVPGACDAETETGGAVPLEDINRRRWPQARGFRRSRTVPPRDWRSISPVTAPDGELLSFGFVKQTGALMKAPVPPHVSV